MNSAEQAFSFPPGEAAPVSAGSSNAQRVFEAALTIPDHQLLFRIGGGSYGEVWLARSVVGTWRAVKVVRRATFERAEHFEREFRGIQKFEPISRSHDAFVDILQIGRNDEAGYFYYVMELADDANAPVAADVRRLTSISEGTGAKTEIDQSLLTSAATYVPKTLRAAIRSDSQLSTTNSQPNRLPVSDCISIGVTLASALAHLHKHGLVHRDVKPSNIIFVNGVPKLADIGLVVETSEAKSFVGTVGFIPPEGPGAPQADLYSLGKVLYEISTGQDRQDFPQLPPDLLRENFGMGSARVSRAESGVSPDSRFTDLSEDAEDQVNEVFGGTPKTATETVALPAPLIELNEVLLRACHKDLRQRYPSADAMRADLELLQRGQSVQRKRVVERRWKIAKRTALVTGLVVLLTASWGVTSRNIFPRQTRLEISAINRQEAERLYQQGRSLINEQTKDGFFRGVQCLNQAVAKNPSHVGAYAGLAHGYLMVSDWFLPSKQTAGEVKKNALKALEIDPNRVEGHVWLGVAMMFFEYDWGGAEREFQKAIELEPKSGLAHGYYATLLQYQGRLPEGRKQQWLAYETASDDLNAMCALNYQFMAEGLYDQVIENSRKVLAKNTDHFTAHRDLSVAYLCKSDFQRAQSEIEICQRLEDAPDITARLGCVYARSGRPEEARRIIRNLEELEHYHQFSPYYYASIFVALDEHDRALDCLEKAYRERSMRLVQLKTDPLLASLWSSHRFIALLKQIGLEK